MKKLSNFQKAFIAETTHEFTIIGKAVVNEDFTFREVNAGLCRLLGISQGDLIGKSIEDITPPLIREIELANARLIRDNKLYHFVLPKPYKPSKDSRLIYAMISMIAVPQNPPNEKEFECFYIEIMELSMRQYIKTTKEILGSHPELLEGRYTSVANFLSLLRRYSLKELAEIVVRVTIVALLVIVALREGKAKALEVFQEIF